MYRALETFILILFLHSFVSGQTAIDFTETDINGVEHRLYDYLDDGKVVILDVFTSDCGPCWNLHQSKTLQFLHDVLGPETMDEVVVLSFEVDTDSDNNNLLGLEEGALGDFVTGTPFPIFNPSEISAEFTDVFVNGGYPTINVICPESKEIVFAGINNYYGLLQSIQTCGTLPQFNDLIPAFSIGPKKVCSSVEPAYSILNGGTEQVPLILNLLKDGVVVHENANFGQIAGGQLRHIKFFDHEVSNGGNDFTVEIATEDDNPENNTYTSTITKTEPLSNKVTLHMETEYFFVPLQETVTWIVKDSDDQIVQQGTVEYDASYEIDLDLEPAECYTFMVDGSHNVTLFEVIELRDENQMVLPLSSYLTDNLTVNFSTDLQNSQEDLEADISLDVYPSPVEDVLSVKIGEDFKGNIEMIIIQMNGGIMNSEIVNYSNGENEKNIDVSELNSGVYFLQVNSRSTTKIVKFVKI